MVNFHRAIACKASSTLAYSCATTSERAMVVNTSTDGVARDMTYLQSVCDCSTPACVCQAGQRVLWKHAPLAKWPTFLMNMTGGLRNAAEVRVVALGD